MSNTTKLTRKEALVILYKVKDAALPLLFSSEATEELALLGTQVYEALNILTIAVHGEAKPGETKHLCGVCYLRYVPTNNPFVYLRANPARMVDLCIQCLEHLKAEGKIDHLENWLTGEVTPC